MAELIIHSEGFSEICPPYLLLEIYFLEKWMGKGALVKEGTGEKNGVLDMLMSRPDGLVPSACPPIPGQNCLKMCHP